jgi:energy-coupling factor transport system substrate-specific component
MLELAALAALAGVALILAGIETGPNRSRELALVAALAAAAAAGRVVFAAIPNVQPVTMIVAVAGTSLGPRAGLATGAGAALASNAFLGQGPWTPWQMLGWGLVGVLAGWMPGLLRHRLGLAAFGVVCGFGFDWLMDVWAWSALGPGADASSFIALISAGIWFDVAHAAGNAVIALVAGPGLIRMLDRYDRRLRGSFAPLEGT